MNLIFPLRWQPEFTKEYNYFRNSDRISRKETFLGNVEYRPIAVKKLSFTDFEIFSFMLPSKLAFPNSFLEILKEYPR